ncbi:DUF2931 family protein [Pseudomonas sp. SIMBA_077]
MKRLKTLALFVGFLILCSCTSDSFLSDRDPKGDTWSLEILSPPYMQSWAEMVVVEDLKGRSFRSPGGVLGSGNDNLEREYAKGWNSIGGGSHILTGADLPKRIYVRWQSIIEQKTYKGWVDIPEEARQLMRGSVMRKCPGWPERRPANHSAQAILGLAPGGVVGVWVGDNCLNRHQVARVHVGIEPLGPYQGQSSGKYRPIKEQSKRYIERYGIPYGSW